MRCYNGAWDSEAMALFAEQDRMLKRIRVREPDAHVTYFPMEGKYQVHVWGNPLSGFHDTTFGALADAAIQLNN
jgi:hypothetical protein